MIFDKHKTLLKCVTIEPRDSEHIIAYYAKEYNLFVSVIWEHLWDNDERENSMSTYHPHTLKVTFCLLTNPYSNNIEESFVSINHTCGW